MAHLNVIQPFEKKEFTVSELIDLLYGVSEPCNPSLKSKVKIVRANTVYHEEKANNNLSVIEPMIHIEGDFEPGTVIIVLDENDNIITANGIIK